ncbi:MAG: hypothetical protein GY832_13740, partial [Chloroflexi bacterium]|nr:hypothetical protein [Chloroflexota bacterium]
MNPKMITRLCRAVIALLLAALLLTVSVALVLAGGPGDLDPTFDDDGRVTADFDGGHDLGNGMVIQPDGKIIVAGQIPNNSTAGSDFGLARLNSDGSLDTSFDTDGFANADFGADDVAFAVARQSDGKIIVAGRVWVTGPGYNFGLARYNSNGSLDTGFDTDGKVDTDFYISSDSGNAVAIQSADGKIVVAGDIHNGTNYDFGLARYNSNGSLDTNFDTDGKVNTDFSSSYDYGKAVAIQADGKIVVAGYTNSSGNYDFGLARYNSNGSLDTSFDTDGRVTTDFAGASDQGFAVAIQTDGKIVVVGSVNGGADFGLARYNSNGSLDTSFDTDGKVTTDFSASNDQANAVVIQSDGKIVVVGQSGLSSATDFALARYNSDGSLDTFFGTGGKLLTDFVGQADYGKAVAIQSDGKIVAAGYRTDLNNSRDFALTRYKALTFDKSVDDVYPSPGQRITFTLIVRNGAPFSQTNGYISDNLPDGLTLAGPVVLDPSSAGTTGSPPALASGLTITNNELITITFPVTVSASLTNTTLITNTATFTSTEIITPRTASAGIEVRVDCAATIDSSTIYTTVQAAVNAASANDTIKVAGYCLGVVSQGAVSQTVYITKNLTLRGGYSDSWADPPDPVANPTVLDANGSGRVVVVTAAAVSVTLENLRLTGGTADSGGGVWNEGILTLDSVSVDGN